jgi:hypothetical protein
MTDVLTIAMNRRDKLRAEIGRVDQFLRLAVELLDSLPAEATAQAPVESKPARSVEPESVREVDAVQPAKHDATAKPTPNGRESIFRGAFAETDEMPKVVNG